MKKFEFYSECVTVPAPNPKLRYAGDGQTAAH